MGKIKIIGTGLSGLIGTRLTGLLKEKYEFENLSLETGFDITDKKSVFEKIEKSNALIMLHMAAKTNVDSCEEDKEKDIRILGYQDTGKQLEEWKKEKTAWFINVISTENIIKACQKFKKKVVYVSTDFVFDGEKEDGYTEDDLPNPVNWYAQTKYEGEKLIQSLRDSYLIMRIAYPYRAFFERNDFVRGIIQCLQNKQKLEMVTDHIMTPTFIDDIARAFDLLVETNSTGIYHAVGSQFVSPYEAGLLIAETFNLNHGLISKITREEYFKDKAPRPFFLGIKNDKIQKLGFKMLGFTDGLLEIKRQIEGE